RCGSRLAHRCPSCRAENRVGVRFCEECGTPLTETVPPTVPQPPPSLAPHPAGGPAERTALSALTNELPAEERRLVTALFCDLVGLTPLSEQLDPEEVRDIQTVYFSAMSTHITRYGGVVEKYAGDAVLALFGAPIAHE